MKRRTRIVPGKGIACPRCGRPTQIHEHANIGVKQRRQRYYFRRWFCCPHENCKTKLVMRDEFKVMNDHELDNSLLEAEVEEAQERYFYALRRLHRATRS